MKCRSHRRRSNLRKLLRSGTMASVDITITSGNILKGGGSLPQAQVKGGQIVSNVPRAKRLALAAGLPGMRSRVRLR